MEYPKAIMRKQELIDELNYSETFLDRAFRSKGQTFAWKISNKRNSPIEFDTAGLEKYRLTQCGLGR